VIDLSKSNAPLVDNTGSTPGEVSFTLTYRVASQGKGSGLFARVANKLAAVDLDVLALCFNASNQVISVAGPHDLSPFPNGSVRHTGDASASGGGTASETVVIRPADVPVSVAGIILAVVAYGNSDLLGKLAQAVLTLTDGQGGQIAEDYLSIERGVQGQLLVALRRDGAAWEISPFVRPVGQAGSWEAVASAARDALVRG
jgi:stress response protein SCP2